MKDISKAVKIHFFYALLMSCAFVVGIPLIPVGAVCKLWAVMAFGIACVVIGFYGLPFMWIGYADKLKLKRIVQSVLEEKLLSIEEISIHLNLQIQVVRDNISKAIDKGYLAGYIRQGDLLVPNERLKAPDPITVKCESCGAKFIKDDKNNVCPYCGNPG